METFKLLYVDKMANFKGLVYFFLLSIEAEKILWVCSVVSRVSILSRLLKDNRRRYSIIQTNRSLTLRSPLLSCHPVQRHHRHRRLKKAGLKRKRRSLYLLLRPSILTTTILVGKGSRVDFKTLRLFEVSGSLQLGSGESGIGDVDRK